MTPAETTAALFASSGTTWRDRPVQPPPYVPTAEQIGALYDELFAKVLDPKGPNVAGNRGLRVRTIKPPPVPRPPEGEEAPPPPPTTYALEATPDGTTYHTIAILLADGTEAS